MIVSHRDKTNLLHNLNKHKCDGAPNKKTNQPSEMQFYFNVSSSVFAILNVFVIIIILSYNYTNIKEIIMKVFIRILLRNVCSLWLYLYKSYQDQFQSITKVFMSTQNKIKIVTYIWSLKMLYKWDQKLQLGSLIDDYLSFR